MQKSKRLEIFELFTFNLMLSNILFTLARVGKQNFKFNLNI